VKLAAVILAAGFGQRLGGVAKALIQIQGEALLARLITALQQANVTDVTVISGVHHDAIAALAEPMGARVVLHPNPHLGQQSSVRLALESIAPTYDALMILLCDQPLIEASDVLELQEAFRRQPQRDFCVPMVHGQRGNPVIVSRKAVQSILALDRTVACREFMLQNPQTVWQHLTDNDHFIFDLDSTQDLAALEKRCHWQVTLPASS
jgi:molybdenum cofactor cytidylyltransferase/nicotine blue oxidoreductase